jgi:hypothetical protein
MIANEIRNKLEKDFKDIKISEYIFNKKDFKKI